jgi:hypothetical protein
MAIMGIGKLGAPDTCFKLKNRWLLSIPEISDDRGVNALPPSSSARPTLTFKEQSVEHLSETIWFPVKPDFKPISLKLYDLVKNDNAVFNWIREIYDPSYGSWNFGQIPYENQPNSAIFGMKRDAVLTLYDGCGSVIEKWVYENAYPSESNFGDLDMADGAVLTVDLTLRYDRAYVVNPNDWKAGNIADGVNIQPGWA